MRPPIHAGLRSKGSLTTPEPPSARVVVVADGRAALIEWIQSGRRYFLFPGGEVRQGESPTVAAVREARAGLGLDVEIVGLAYEEIYAGAVQTYYYADVVAGELAAVPWPPELADNEPVRLDDRSDAAIWLPVRQLLAYDVRPYALARRLDQAAHAL